MSHIGIEPPTSTFIGSRLIPLDQKVDSSDQSEKQGAI